MTNINQLRLPTAHKNIFLILSFVNKTTRCAALNSASPKRGIFDDPIACALANETELCEIQADPDEPILWVGTAAFYLRPEDVPKVAQFFGILIPAAKEIA